MFARIALAFESALWASRLIVLVAVLASLALAFASLIVATVETYHLIASVGGVFAHANDPDGHARFLTMVVRCVDSYLLTAILIIFALGLYELFISRIDAAENSDVAPRVLLIRSLDDLKDRLAKVVILILVIEFFQHALEMRVAGFLDLLYLALGTLVVSAALYLSSRHIKHNEDGEGAA
jgi:uncharacterized membrane protein YqhA